MIIYTKEIASFHEFEAWSGGAETLSLISEHNKIDELTEYFEYLFNNQPPMDETEINDWLWFEADAIYQALDIEIEE